MKKAFTIFLLLFVGVSVAVLAFRVAREQAHDAVSKPGYKSLDSRPKPASLASITDENTDVVCYFMNNQRCSNCVKIEEYTKEAIDAGFTGHLEDGTLKWRVINIDEPEYRHFITDFELHTKSVVLVKIRDGKMTEWKNLDLVWSLLRDRDGFQQYITYEVGAFFEES